MEPSRPSPLSFDDLVARLAAAGCVAPEAEARELGAAAGGAETAQLAQMLARRLDGEPLAWVTGGVDFAGIRVRVEPGVYVPRMQSEILVTAAAEVLGEGGLAVDLCTGSGAVAAALRRARPGATVVGTDIDPTACGCARRNGVTVYQGDLDAPLPSCMSGRVDVVTAVAPYVPRRMIDFLPRDVREREPMLALDGGDDGLQMLRAVVVAAARLLRPGGTLVVELGADQDRPLAADLRVHRFELPAEALRDEDGDLRALRARRGR